MKRQLDRRRQQHWCHLQSCCRTFYRANADDALQSRNVRHRQELKPQTTTYFARVTYGPWEGVLGKLLRDSSSSLLLAYRLGLLLKEASCPRVTGPKARLPESQRNKHYARGAPRSTGMMAPLVDPERFPGVIWEHVGRNPDLGLGEDVPWALKNATFAASASHPSPCCDAKQSKGICARLRAPGM